MTLRLAERESDSSWVSAVWTSTSGEVAEMTSLASDTWGLVFWRQEDRSFAAVTGPESRTSSAPVPQHAQFVGVQFAVGTAMHRVATSSMVDSGRRLQTEGRHGFWFDGDRWEVPGADDVEALVGRLILGGAVVRDPLVTRALGDRRTTPDRTLQRRFQAVTGFSRTGLEQIRRARAAAVSLSGGAEVGDVVVALGYYDEPHLARALRRFVGRTAGQLRSRSGGAIALPDSPDDVVDQLHHTVSIGG